MVLLTYCKSLGRRAAWLNLEDLPGDVKSTQVLLELSTLREEKERDRSLVVELTGTR